jgi:hypothetical protein
MRSLARCLLALCLVGISARVARAEPLAYVRTSSQHERQKSPAAYHPLNLLDEDPATVWCEGVDGTGEREEVRFFFKGRSQIDRLVITPALRSGRSIAEVKITDDVHTIRVTLGENQVEQKLSRPLNGSTITLSISEVGPVNKDAQLGDTVACIADVLLYQGGRLFGGKSSGPKLRYDAMRDKVLGKWAGEPFGAPERFVLFALDGTWEWSFVPLLEGKKQKLAGEYRFRGDRLLMRKGETGRWADMRFKYKRVPVDPTDPGAPKGDYDLIQLNEALEEKMKGEYNNAEF